MYIRSSQDLVDIWTEIAKGQKHILWCDGLREPENKKRSKSYSDDEDEDFGRKKRKVDDKEEKVIQTLNQLKKKHEDKFTGFQLRMWSEMLVGGVYTSYDNPPNTSMFLRAGGNRSKKSEAISLSEAAASQTLSPPKAPVIPVASSPAKSIDNRSKCYKQLNELNGLKMAGVLSPEEFDTEKEAIMSVLKTL